MNANNVENFKKQISLINLKNNFGSFEDLIYIQYDKSKMNLDDIEEDLFLKENYNTIEKLNLSLNIFKEITPCFLKFENLKYLNMSYNNISKIFNLKNCINLEFLILSHNEIKNLGNTLTFLKKLQHLDLSYNHLYIYDTIIKLLTLNPKLNSLGLKENENYDFKTIKFKCLEILENLEFLDNKKICSNRNPNIKHFGKNYSSVRMNTITGEKKEIKKLSDYINFKQKDLDENRIQYESIEQNNKMKKLENESKPKDRVLSSYYFNMLKFNK